MCQIAAASPTRAQTGIYLFSQGNTFCRQEWTNVGTKGNLSTFTRSVGLVGAMLYRISRRVAVFYQHAYECNEKARKARDSEERDFYLDMERRWLSLAHQSDLTERLTRIARDIARRYKNSQAEI
jgi:hypothetical protein